MGTKGREFTDTEDNAILLSYEELDCDWPAIAAALERPLKSVKSRYRLLVDNMPIGRSYEPQSRNCLRCHDPFISCGPGNRVCDPCSASNAHVWNLGGRALYEAPSIAPLSQTRGLALITVTRTRVVA
jgi:hypothetical protein